MDEQTLDEQHNKRVLIASLEQQARTRMYNSIATFFDELAKTAKALTEEAVRQQGGR